MKVYIKMKQMRPAVVLLVIVLLINGVSSLIAKRFEAVKE